MFGVSLFSKGVVNRKVQISKAIKEKNEVDFRILVKNCKVSVSVIHRIEEESLMDVRVNFDPVVILLFNIHITLKNIVEVSPPLLTLGSSFTIEAV